LAQWAIRDDGKAPIETATDWVIVITLFVAVAIMLFVLFGILSNAYSPDSAATRYRRLLRLYVVAITVAFTGLAIALFV
jgi:heme/copper-type cytochrome/quinol oxidase subunit 2